MEQAQRKQASKLRSMYSITSPITRFKTREGITSKRCSNSPSIRVPASPLLERLGYGTGVTVYLMERSPRNGVSRSPWAVKKLNKLKDTKSNKNFAKRLKEESDILKQLKHKNIIGFRALAKTDNGMPCLAMEDAEKSLYSMIEDRMEEELGIFPPNDIMKLAMDVAEGLAYLHDKSILHGDMKSGNLLVKGDFEIVKICDFGTAMRLDKNLKAKASLYIGTPAWSASETISGKFVSDRTDIYSYGLVLYEMLTLLIPNFDVFPEEEDFSDEEEFNSAYENAELKFDSLLGQRPSLPNVKYDKNYHKPIEIFYVCTEEEQKRPSASQLVKEFNPHTDLKRKLDFLGS